jgi:hypothetical protein
MATLIRGTPEFGRCRQNRTNAHVLAHEIVHILEGCSRHSASGLMKAQWNKAEISQMQSTDLPIAREDIDLVHRGMEKRASGRRA